ncbi:hypothetical protein [Halarcobacter sp.]|uniref:hypothetical protein n=1 Tax=Halarcobacter sp. TaxID=2321133 RepID=UPI0029F5602E|nr:hypothetical protein [Halarcobacter sp.]
MLKLKILVLMFFLSFQAFGIEVLVTKKDIDYKELINLDDLYKSNVTSVKKFCEPVAENDFRTTKYRASRYLRKGTIICTKDLDKDKNNSVLFNFGSIQIERPGKIIFENDEYIRIKREDGQIEKIYKDGRIE